MEQSQTPPQTEVVDTTTVACGGGGGALGHPKVYLSMGSGGQVACPYCSRRFVLAENAQQA